MKPEVSIIIPAYNTENYISKAIDSALSQTLGNIEIIVVDDASSDKTLEMIRKFNDPRLKVLVNEKNIGASGTRNLALREAKGEWIAVLDSDDWYVPERLEKLVQIAYSENADMVADNLFYIEDGQDYSWSTLLNESGESINQAKLIDPVYFVEVEGYGRQSLHLGLSKPIFNRDFLIRNGIEYDELLTIQEDFWLDLECLVSGAKFIFVPESYYFYRSRLGSLIYSNTNKSLELYCHKIRDFMARETIVKRNPDLVKALSEKLTICQQHLAYHRVIEPLKKKEYLELFIQILHNPYFLIHLFRNLPDIIGRRIEYYILGNKSAFTLAHLRKRNTSKHKRMFERYRSNLPSHVKKGE